MRPTAVALIAALLPIAAVAGAEPLPTRLSIEEDGERAAAWVQERIANAREGRREIVRLPVTLRSLGWGCRCPEAYVGVDPDGNVLGAGWLELDAEPGVTLPAQGREGAVALVEGWFTGETAKEDLRDEHGEPEEWLYTLDRLHVTRARPLRSGDAQELRVALGPPESTRAVERLADARAWVVIAGTGDLGAPQTASWAQKLVDRLRDKGFAEAAALDSRALGELWCCAVVVIGGRFETQAQAQELARAMKEKGFQASVRRGFEPPPAPDGPPGTEGEPAPAAPAPGPATD